MNATATTSCEKATTLKLCVANTPYSLRLYPDLDDLQARLDH